MYSIGAAWLARAALRLFAPPDVSVRLQPLYPRRLNPYIACSGGVAASEAASASWAPTRESSPHYVGATQSKGNDHEQAHRQSRGCNGRIERHWRSDCEGAGRARRLGGGELCVQQGGRGQRGSRDHHGGDVSKAADAQGIIDAAVETYGRLDILVNNSGVYEFAQIEEITEEHFHKHFNVNVLGLLLTTQAAVKHLGEGGSIVNVSSVVTRLTPPGSAVYTGTKGAVDGITGVLARELGPRKIRVNSVNPGMIATEGTHSAGIVGSDLEQWAISTTPLGRIGQPDEVADVAVFLASDDSRWMTGETLIASGGAR
jgi:3-oxoacyl-[acyl-carrier protein] reductase